MLLRSMRSGFLSALFLGLLVLGAASLIISDNTGTLRGRIGTGNIAEVDGTPIKMQEFNSRVSRLLREQNIPPAKAYEMGVINSVLGNEVSGILIQKDAAAMGIRVSDEVIAQQVKVLITPLKSQGLSDKDALKKFLELQGMSEKQLVSALRTEFTSKILTTTISSAPYIPKSMIKDLETYSSATKNIDVVFVPNSSVSVDTKPSDSELKAYYQTKSGAFMKPETRDFTIAILDTSKIKKVTVNDSDVKAVYDESKDELQTPEQVNIEQSVVREEKKAKEIIATINSGKSMLDAVKTVTGDAKSFMGKNSFEKNGLPSEIADPVFAGKDGDIIGPIKSALGYHVIKLLNKTAAQIPPLEKVKDKIRADLQEEYDSNKVYEVTNDIEERLANGETYDSLSKDYSITISTIASLTKESKPGKDIGYTNEEFNKILTKGFFAKDNQPSELVDLSASKAFSVKADKINPAAPQPFAEVKAKILEMWTADNQTKKNVASAQVKINDLTAEKIKFVDLNPVNLPSVSRKGDDKIAKDVMDRILNAEIGKYILAISNDRDGVYISRVNSISLPKDIKIDEEAKNKLEGDIVNANYMTYMESLQKKYPVKINDALIKRIYDRKETSTE